MSDLILEGYFMENTEEGKWELVLEFDTDDPEFARGFTCGQIWQLMELDTPGIELTVPSNILWMCAAMADAKGYAFEGEELNTEVPGLEDADWVYVTFTKIQEADNG